MQLASVGHHAPATSAVAAMDWMMDMRISAGCKGIPPWGTT